MLTSLHFLSGQLSWYTGYNLAQTVLTCLYAHKPQAVPNR